MYTRCDHTDANIFVNMKCIHLRLSVNLIREERMVEEKKSLTRNKGKKKDEGIASSRKQGEGRSQNR